jgi:rhodanese-related sulfurtransferase
MEKEGYVYVDVRSIPEFEAGHPAGAYNVPLMHQGPAGMTPNPEFLEVMQRAFPRDAKLLVSCKAGGRSARAASVLESAGFTQIVDQTAGYEGKPDASGRMLPGWRPAGLPVTRDAAPGHGYEALKAGRG